MIFYLFFLPAAMSVGTKASSLKISIMKSAISVKKEIKICFSAFQILSRQLKVDMKFWNVSIG